MSEKTPGQIAFESHYPDGAWSLHSEDFRDAWEQRAVRADKVYVDRIDALEKRVAELEAILDDIERDREYDNIRSREDSDY